MFYDTINYGMVYLPCKGAKMATTYVTSYNPATQQYETSITSTPDEDTIEGQKNVSSEQQATHCENNNSCYHEIATVLSALQSSL